MLNDGYSKSIGRDRQNAKAETDRRGTVEEIRIDRHGCGAGRRKERIENLNSGKGIHISEFVVCNMKDTVLVCKKDYPHRSAQEWNIKNININININIFRCVHASL